MRAIWISLRALVFFTIVTGVLYPLLITGVAGLVFPARAGGSLIERAGKVVGSELLAQKVEAPEYFAFRPSATDYATVASGASNLSPASRKFVQAVSDRQKALGDAASADALTTSASGLDPHISVDNAQFQTARIARARQLTPSQTDDLRELVKKHIEGKTFGILGQERVNVMRLNVALDERFSER